MRRLMERQRRALASHDAGFTLIEIIVAMVLVVIVMTALLGIVVSSLITVAQARQRQMATGLATQSLEQLRAIPYLTLTTSDATNFPLSTPIDYVSGTSPNYRFTPTAGILPGVNEALVVNEYSGKRVTPAPVDGVSYTVQTYVTKPAPTGAGEQAYNITATVTWSSPSSPTSRTIVERSTAYSPAGCLSTANHPFSGPCQAYFTAKAGLSAAGFTVTNSTDSTAPILGMNGRLLALDLPDLSTSLQIEQTASGTALAGTSGARSVTTGGTTSIGNVAAATSVDSDPSSTPNQSASVTKSQSSVTPTTLTGTGTLSATPTNGDTAGSAAAIAAASSTCSDGDSSGTPLNTGPDSTSLRPCASANARQLSTGAAITYAPPSGITVSVLSLAAAPSLSHAVAAQLAGTNGTACSTSPGASAPGCAHSAAFRSMGDLIVGAPTTGGTSSLTTANGLFRVTGLTESVVAERGIGAAATPTYSRAGHIYFWNGSGYTDVNLANYKDPASGLVPASETWNISTPVTINYTTGSVTVSMTASITVQRPQRTVSDPTGCLADACVAQINGGGGIRAQTTFVVTSGGTELTRFVLVADVGGLLAQSTYKAAPSG